MHNLRISTVTRWKVSVLDEESQHFGQQLKVCRPRIWLPSAYLLTEIRWINAVIGDHDNHEMILSMCSVNRDSAIVEPCIDRNA